MKKLFLTAGILAFATISLFTSCKDEDLVAGTITTGDVTIDQTEKEAAIDQAKSNIANDAVDQAAATVDEGTTTQYGVAGTVTNNDDGSTTQTFTDATAGTTTTVNKNKEEEKNESTGTTTVTVTEEATTKDAEGNVTGSTTTTTEVVTPEAQAGDQGKIVLPTTTTTTEEKDAEGNIIGGSTTTTSYQYTYSVDGVNYDTEAEMLSALQGKTTTATVVITLVETTTTIGFDGTVTTTQRVSTQTSIIEVPENTQTTTAVITYPTTINADPNGVSLTNSTVSVTIVPQVASHSGGGGR